MKETQIQKAKRLIQRLIHEIVTETAYDFEDFVGKDLAKEIDEFLDEEEDKNTSA